MNRMFALKAFIIQAIILFLTVSCDKEVRIPIIGRTAISDRKTHEAIAESWIFHDGNAAIKECGFCWNTKGDPTMDDFCVEAELTYMKLSAVIKGLSEGTTYYIRSYAINRAGVSYGEVRSFTTISYRLPVVNSPYIQDVSHDMVVCGGARIVDDNTDNIISKGICWSTIKNPTVNDSKTELGGGYGYIGATIEGLMPGTVYYFRAYAVNAAGTAYSGNAAARTFDGFMTDYEGNIYSTVRLGNQEWINRNLRTAYFSNGDKISTTYPPDLNTEQEENPLYQWAFKGEEEPAHLIIGRGRLYTWFTASDNRNLCPAGWHLPTLDEWNELIVHLGGETLSSGDLRECFNFHWNPDHPLFPGRDEGCFLPHQAGFREVNGLFLSGYSYGTYWWSATEESSGNAFAIFYGPSDLDKVKPYEKTKKYGFSVRCVKD